MEDGALRLVLLCRHFPPAVSGGARRPYYVFEALRQAGHDVRVIAPELPPGVPGVVAPHPSPDPSIAAPSAPSLRDHLRTWLLLPDPDIRWARRAAAAAINAITEPVDWVITTSPPESLHAAGRRLQRQWRCGWLADLRDHWFDRAFRLERRDPLRRWIERPIARHLLARADLVTTVNQAIAEEARTLGAAADHTHVLAHFAPPPGPAWRFDGPGPHIAHTGSFSLSDPDCSIGPTLVAFATAHAARPSLRLHLVGRLSHDEISAVHASPARAGVVLHGVAPLDQSLAMQRGADALLVAAAPTCPHPPGKFVEYLAADRPVIAAGEGPWRRVIGLAEQNAADAMMALPDYRDTLAPIRPASAADAAQALVSLMRAHGPPSR